MITNDLYHIRVYQFEPYSIEWFAFPFPDIRENRGLWYRTANAINAFFFCHSKSVGRYRNWTDKRLMSLRRPPELIGYELEEVKELGVKQFDTIFDFFEHIQFDYKNKKYLTGEILRKHPK